MQGDTGILDYSSLEELQGFRVLKMYSRSQHCHRRLDARSDFLSQEGQKVILQSLLSSGEALGASK